MFTGIVTEVGTVEDNVGTDDGARRVTIQAPSTTKDLAVGDSVAVAGVCLTATAVVGDRFTVDVVPESLARTALGALASGTRVNLERPVPTGGRFDGHVVQGHIDGVGTVAEMRRDGDAVVIRIDLPGTLGPYLVEKGSVAVDGVSLTVTAVDPRPEPAGRSWFEIALIPHTLAVTTFGERRAGDAVNVEVDIIAKYVERWMETRT